MYSSRLNVVTWEKSSSSSRCSRINSLYSNSGVLPVAIPSTQSGFLRTRSATKRAARRETAVESGSMMTRKEIAPDITVQVPTSLYRKCPAGPEGKKDMGHGEHGRHGSENSLIPC